MNMLRKWLNSAKIDLPNQKQASTSDSQDPDDFVGGHEAITRIKEWNKSVMKGTYTEEDINGLDDMDDMTLTYLFLRNCVDVHMALLEGMWDGNIQDLNLATHVVLFNRFERTVLNELGVDGNSVIPNRAQLTYDLLVFCLTGKDRETMHELNDMWKTFYNTTPADLYNN